MRFPLPRLCPASAGLFFLELARVSRIVLLRKPLPRTPCAPRPCFGGAFSSEPQFRICRTSASAASLAARFGSSYVSMTTRVSRPSQAAISLSPLLIFSFRAWGHLERRKGARYRPVLRPFALLYDVSSVPPKVPPKRNARPR